MSQGFLLFAHDNEQISYGSMAVHQAKSIHKWLGKPVSIVTDQKTLKMLGSQAEIFDQVILSDVQTNQKKNYNGQQLTFNNTDRCAAWQLTPYEETMIIDTDIIIQSDRMNTVWGADQDLMVCRNCKDIFGRKFAGFDYLSNYGIEFIWATVFYFKKNDLTKVFFDLCNQIKKNYVWYAHVYDITTKYIRNDHVWSIALHELGGRANCRWATKLPFNLFYSLDTDEVFEVDNNSVLIYNKDRIARVTGCDVHVMNKQSLLKKIN